MSISPWSFSRIKSFEQCPKQFYHLKIAKDYEEEQTSAMTYGTELHAVAENYVQHGEDIPRRFGFMKPVLDSLKNKKGKKYCEVRMGLTQNLSPCSFTSKQVWWRGIADLIIIDDTKAWVIDYKSSKSAKYADKGQLELMALSVFSYMPKIDTINAGLLFVVCKQLVKQVYTRSGSNELWDKWISNYKKMETAYNKDVWNARPSGLCRRHCPVIECIHNGSNN
tara:strand:- start:445 stop:1113 length:669 start_codon:yes stop_codon:yes gene_type:complete